MLGQRFPEFLTTMLSSAGEHASSGIQTQEGTEMEEQNRRRENGCPTGPT